MRFALLLGSTFLVALLFLAAACRTVTPLGGSADLVFQNGVIYTVDEEVPRAEAIAIEGDRVVAVGTDEEIHDWIGEETTVIDLQGRLVLPGFIEGHGHFMSLGQAKMMLDLNEAGSWEEIVAMVGEAAKKAKKGEWIRGRGWHQEKWSHTPSPSVEGLPLHDSLSAVSPDNPVLLGHASGHAAFANGLALQLAGIDESTEDPPGGTIVKDASGRPTGALREKAQGLVGAARQRDREGMTADQIEAERRRMVDLAAEECLRKGVTTFHDAGSSFDTIDFFRDLAEKGELPLRLYVMVRFASNEEMDRRLPDYRLLGVGNQHLTVRSIKRQIDGALGPHGAWLLEPYEDLPESSGLVLETVEDITGTAEVAIRHGFQVNTHAIGDRANREVLDIYEKTFKANPDKEDLRWRVEHAQHLHPDDIQRFADLGVIASMQGVHCTSDGPWVLKRLGEARAASGAYLWRTLLKAGVVVTNGTDVPVEDVDPIACFYATVSRRTSDGDIFYGAEKMTREQALYSYTLANAYAAFEEDVKGSLTVGKLADLVVVSKNLMTIPEEEIPSAKIDLTVVGGEVLYDRSAPAQPPY